MTYRPTSALPVAIAFALWSTAAHADRFTDAVVQRYQELGFDYIEVKEGVNQLKVEAIRGSKKYEVIYDRDSGRILKQETEAARANEIGRSGVEIDTEDRDFISRNDINDDEFDDDESDESDDNESDESDDEENDDQSDESDNDEGDESDDDENDSDESDESSDESDDDESSGSGNSGSGSDESDDDESSGSGNSGSGSDESDDDEGSGSSNSGSGGSDESDDD